jgi:hypothetical protein
LVYAVVASRLATAATGTVCREIKSRHILSFMEITSVQIFKASLFGAKTTRATSVSFSLNWFSGRLLQEAFRQYGERRGACQRGKVGQKKLARFKDNSCLFLSNRTCHLSLADVRYY